MKIEVTADTFKLAQVFTISRGSRTEAKVLTVRLTQGGVTGWGECVPYARYEETLESVTAQIEALPGDITREALYGLLPAGAARNAVDCALWDLEAKRAGKRVWELAGLSAPGPEITAYTLSLDEPEAMRAQAAKHAHRPLLKIKRGTPDDMPGLEAVRAGALQVLKKNDCKVGLEEFKSVFKKSGLEPMLVKQELQKMVMGGEATMGENDTIMLKPEVCS